MDKTPSVTKYEKREPWDVLDLRRLGEERSKLFFRLREFDPEVLRDLAEQDTEVGRTAKRVLDKGLVKGPQPQE